MEDVEYQFEQYNNWPNKMTWAVFTEIGSDNDIYLTLHDLGEAGGQEAVKMQVLTWVDYWFERRKVPESVNVFMQSVLNTGIDYA